MSGILFFIFASCEPLSALKLLPPEGQGRKNIFVPNTINDEKGHTLCWALWSNTACNEGVVHRLLSQEIQDLDNVVGMSEA